MSRPLLAAAATLLLASAAMAQTQLPPREAPLAILNSGTRDLLLSNTVRVNQKLREAGIDTRLQLFEGQSHAHFSRDDRIPEVKEAFGEIAAFFDKHLAASAGQ